MFNPFEKRATEFLQDDETFLSVVSPEPLVTFFKEKAEQGVLYDRLVTVVGTPGSGKTTLATLFQFKTLQTLLRSKDIPARKDLLAALSDCRAIEDERATVIGCRLPMESGYREFWQFDYPAEFKSLLLYRYIQARAMLAWLRNVQLSGGKLEAVSLIVREDAGAAAVTAMGGVDGPSAFKRASEIEKAVYSVAAALIPPPIDKLPSSVLEPYSPFEVLKGIEFKSPDGTSILQPLVILDDAHHLHPDQFSGLLARLSARELKISRWIVTRFDALAPVEVLTPDDAVSKIGTAVASGTQPTRDRTTIWFQARPEEGDDRRSQRIAFRGMARSMGARYLRLMSSFDRRGIRGLSDFLPFDPVAIPPSEQRDLQEKIDKVQGELSIKQEQREELQAAIANYVSASQAQDIGADIKLAMLRILMYRYANKRPQKDMFDADDTDGTVITKPLSPDSSILEGARVHLYHEYGRPFYYGVDSLSDASDQNAEMFLTLAAELVAEAEARLIRKRSAVLTAREQHETLVQRARKLIKEWNFPECERLRTFITAAGEDCLARSLESNASLGGGANAIGIPQVEFNKLTHTHPDIARTLQYGVGYNVISIVPNHKTKNSLWCLLELGGVCKLHTGLTLKRGGFIECKTRDLERYLSRPS